MPYLAPMPGRKSSIPEASPPLATRPCVWLIPAVAVCLLAVLLAGDYDRPLFLHLNALGTGTPDWVWADLTLLGNGGAAMALALIAVYRRPGITAAVVYTAVITALASAALKDLVDSTPPPGILGAAGIHLIGPGYTSHSFPSGHTATAFALAGAVSLTFRRRWLTVALCTGAAAVGLSRIMVGVHWPVDVCGGAALGWLCAAAGVALAARRAPAPAVQTALAAPLYLAAAALWWPHLTPYRDALPLQYAAAVISWAAGAAALPRLLRRGKAGGGA